MKQKNSGTWGGARKGSGPIVRNIHLDMETAKTLRLLTRQRRAVSPDISEERIVTEMIQAAWTELNGEFETAAAHQDGE